MHALCTELIERMHIGALRAWFEGDWERAVERWGRVSIAYPRDLLALQFAHLGDFYLGYSHMLRDRVARVLPHWNQDTPGFGFVKGSVRAAPEAPARNLTDDPYFSDGMRLGSGVTTLVS